ncbi:prepilin peptidase [Vibrio sp. 16]|uniref:prepilin peptidase n=1 Tax=Vibrio sp. 16 TaxID=391586 RepID=UPI00030CC297
MVTPTFIWWLILATICLFICWRDYRFRLVSNNSVLSLGCVLLSSAFINGSQIYPFTALMLFIPGLLLWRLGAFGAGDIKLICVFSLLIQPDFLLLVGVILMLLGGLEALVYILIKKFKPISIVHDGLPFAIPIVLSGVFGIGASI